MNPDKRFENDEINRLKRGAPSGFAFVNKKPRPSYNPRRPDARSSHVHPQGPHVAPRRPSGGLEPKRFTNSLFSIPIQNQSSQIHTQSNNTASLPLLVRPWADGRQTHYCAGDPLFVKKDHSRRLRTVHDLVSINNAFEDAENNKNTDTVNNIIDEYKFYGIYRNKTNVENQGFASGSFRHQDALQTGRNQQELINVDVFGRSKIFNIFGKVKRGDHLGLALFKYEGKLSDGSSASLTRYFPTLNDEVVPVKHFKKIYESKNLSTQPSIISGQVLSHIPLGICSFSTKSTEWGIDKVHDFNKIRELPQLEFLML